MEENDGYVQARRREVNEVDSSSEVELRCKEESEANECRVDEEEIRETDSNERRMKLT
jgi:hypothetical protein